MAELNFFSKLSSWLQILIVICGLLTPSLAYVKWIVDKKITVLKDTYYSQKLSSLSPRKLSIEQKRILISSLSPIKGHSIALASRILDGESSDFADEIAQTFKDAGLNVGITNRTNLNDLPGYVVIGITNGGVREDANLISQTLNSAGINCKFEKISDRSINGLLPNYVYVIVGRKGNETDRK